MQQTSTRPPPFQITINKDKGSLSPEEIERMVKEAENFAQEDKKVWQGRWAGGGLSLLVIVPFALPFPISFSIKNRKTTPTFGLFVSAFFL